MEDAGAMEARAVVAMAAVTFLRGDWCIHGAVSGSRSGSSEGGAEVSCCCCRCGDEKTMVEVGCVTELRRSR